MISTLLTQKCRTASDWKKQHIMVLPTVEPSKRSSSFNDDCDAYYPKKKSIQLREILMVDLPNDGGGEVAKLCDFENAFQANHTIKQERRNSAESSPQKTLTGATRVPLQQSVKEPNFEYFEAYGTQLKHCFVILRDCMECPPRIYVNGNLFGDQEQGGVDTALTESDQIILERTFERAFHSFHTEQEASAPDENATLKAFWEQRMLEQRIDYETEVRELLGFTPSAPKVKKRRKTKKLFNPPRNRRRKFSMYNKVVPNRKSKVKRKGRKKTDPKRAQPSENPLEDASAAGVDHRIPTWVIDKHLTVKVSKRSGRLVIPPLRKHFF